MKIFSARISVIVFAVAVLAGCQPEPAPTEPLLEDGWIRAVAPGMRMTAGYGTLRNVTEKTIEINAFSSPAFRDVSLHLSEEVDGVSSMREIESITLAPGESLVMERGSYHLMLMVPMQSTAPGQLITLEMASADGRTFVFEVPTVR